MGEKQRTGTGLRDYLLDRTLAVPEGTHAGVTAALRAKEPAPAGSRFICGYCMKDLGLPASACDCAGWKAATAKLQAMAAENLEPESEPAVRQVVLSTAPGAKELVCGVVSHGPVVSLSCMLKPGHRGPHGFAHDYKGFAASLAERPAPEPAEAGPCGYCGKPPSSHSGAELSCPGFETLGHVYLAPAISLPPVEVSARELPHLADALSDVPSPAFPSGHSHDATKLEEWTTWVTCDGLREPHRYSGACCGVVRSVPAPEVEDARLEAALAERDRLTALINTPEILDFVKAVQIEAVHQRERWGAAQDEGKTGADWFWLLGYLAGKALYCDKHGDREKLLHHIITTAAACANWHAQVLGKCDMRPGIATPAGEAR